MNLARIQRWLVLKEFQQEKTPTTPPHHRTPSFTAPPLTLLPYKLVQQEWENDTWENIPVLIERGWEAHVASSPFRARLMKSYEQISIPLTRDGNGIPPAAATSVTRGHIDMPPQHSPPPLAAAARDGE